MAAAVRRTTVEARSTDVFGRVAWSARNHHQIADGPEANGCPGEALTPPELFLGGVAACAVELIGVIAKADGVDVRAVRARIDGAIDPEDRVRQDVNVFNSVRVHVEIDGVTDEQGRALVEAFKGR